MANRRSDPNPGAFEEVADELLEDIEDVDVDDDVSVADVTGEAALPTAEISLDELITDSTAPRIQLSGGQKADPKEAGAPAAHPPPPVLRAIQLQVQRLAPGAVRAETDDELLDEDTAESERAAPAGEPPRPAPVEPDAETTSQTGLPSHIEALIDEVPAPSPAPECVPEEVLLAGNLSGMPLADVLGLLSRQRQSGVLYAKNGRSEISIYLQNGRVALATGSGFPDLRLGRFILEIDAAAQEDIDEVMKERPQREQPAPLGIRLYRVGYLSRDDLRQVLARQTQEIIYEGLRMRCGRFVFTQPATLPRLAVDRSMGGDLDLDLEALLLEGYRRIHDWHLLQRDIEEAAVYLRAEERTASLERAGLTPKEQQVLSLCTGRLSVGEVARESKLMPLEVVRILMRLQAVHLVRRRLPPQVA